MNAYFRNWPILLASLFSALHLVTTLAFAQNTPLSDLKLSGQLKYEKQASFFESDELGAELGPNTTLDDAFELRVLSRKPLKEFASASLDFGIDLELLGIAGTGVETRRKTLESSPFSAGRHINSQ